jgi:hypothetical protein
MSGDGRTGRRPRAAGGERRIPARRVRRRADGVAKPARPGTGAPANRVALAAFVLLLVAVAFARAQFASSTGIRIAGDGADYEVMAASMALEGRAPFVYRPAVPLLVGAVAGDDLRLGFVALCAAAMFAALYGAGSLAPDGLAAYGIAAVLFFNYQVLFAAANPARIDIVVLAVQIGFVALALRRNATLYFALLPLCALLKESLLLSLGALALVAFARRRDLVVKATASVVAFLLVHAAVRAIAVPTAQMPPYDDGVPGVDAALQMLAGNLSLLTPLDLFVAWGGLCGITVWLMLAGDGDRRRPLLPLVTVFLLLFPLPLVTDVHRAWFELLAPATLFLLLPQLTPVRRRFVYPALTLALVGGVVPYAVRFVAPDHLFLLILEHRLTAAAVGAMALALAAAAAALAYWLRARPVATAG